MISTAYHHRLLLSVLPSGSEILGSLYFANSGIVNIHWTLALMTDINSTLCFSYAVAWLVVITFYFNPPPTQSEELNRHRLTAAAHSNAHDYFDGHFPFLLYRVIVILGGLLTVK